MKYIDLEGCACEICDHCIAMYCALYNDNFGKISSPEECEEFELPDEDIEEDDEYSDFDPTEAIECKQCGGDAYWEGDHYACQCGWCSN